MALRIWPGFTVDYYSYYYQELFINLRLQALAASTLQSLQVKKPGSSFIIINIDYTS